MKPTVASIDSVNSKATVRSERLAACSSMSWTAGLVGGQARVGERVAGRDHFAVSVRPLARQVLF